jgi:transcriptional regulator with XRE-family HTH domain
MTDKKPPQNPDFVAALAALTTRHHLTEAQGAGLLGVPVPTLRKWCAGARAPSAAAVRLVEVLGTIEAIAPGLFNVMVPDPAPVTPAKRGRKPSGAKKPL